SEYDSGHLVLLRPQEANIGANKTKLYFNDALGGGSSNSQAITISNTGNFTLTIPAGGLTFTGTDAAQFVITSPTTLPLAIAPGATADIQVAFAPTSTGVKVATLNIQSNDADTP